MSNNLVIEVVFATQEVQEIIALTVPVGATLLQAIEQSGLLEQFAEIDLNRVGIFGQLKKVSEQVSNADRIELYRPLQKDPMRARREREVPVKRKKFKPLRAKDLV